MNAPWGAWLAERHARRVHAAGAALALERGEAGPARALLGDWRFAASPELFDRFLPLLRQQLPCPSPVQLGALLAPEERLPTPPGPFSTRRAHRQWLFAHAPPVDDPTPTERLAWCLDELGVQGQELDRLHRRSWAEQAFPTHPAEDERAARHWRAWAEGRPWTIRADWERLVMPSALRAFQGVLYARKVPPSRVRHALTELSDALFWVFLGDGERPPGWRAVALRVLETVGDAPIGGPEALMSARHRVLAGACAVERGNGALSARQLFPELLHPHDRGRWVRRLPLEQALDLHTALRLLAAWQTAGCSPALSERVIAQNRGRARAKLRALLSAAGDPGPALQAVPALAARTRFATLRFCRDWAWQCFVDDFTFSPSFCPDGLCGLDAPIAPPPRDEERRPLVAWLALVALKGRLGALTGWVRGTGTSTDARWGELLSRDLPASLVDPPAEGARYRSYQRVRTILADNLGELLDEIRPCLQEIATLSTSPALGAQLLQALDPIWDPSVRKPGVQFQRYRENARMALAFLDALPGQL